MGRHETPQATLNRIEDEQIREAAAALADSLQPYVEFQLAHGSKNMLISTEMARRVTILLRVVAAGE